MTNSFDVQARFTAKDETSATFLKLTQSTRSLRSELARLTADQKVADAQARLAANNTLKNAQALERAQGRQMIVANQAKLAQIKSLQEIEKLGSSGSSAMSNLSGVISGGVVASLAAATAGAIAFGNALNAASQREIAGVRSATALGREFGIGRVEATKLNQSITREVLNQNPAFASNDIALQLSNLFSDDIGKAVGKAQVAKTTAQFASKFAALMVGDEGNIGQLTNVLGDVLSGGQTVSQLKTRDIFNTTGINKVLIPMLQSAGVDNLGDIDMAKRLGFVMAALNQVATDESLQTQAKTVAGQWAQVQKKLFDPFSGVLGVERDLGNGSSVFESFKRTMNLLFSDSGLFAQIGTLMGGFDPMKILNSGLQGINNLLEALTPAIAQGDAAQVGTLIGKFAADLFNTLTRGVVSNLTPENVANFMIPFFAAIGNGFLSFVTNLDWISLLQAIPSGTLALAGTLGTLIANAATTAGSMLVSAITQGVSALGSAIGSAISSSIGTVTSTLQTTIGNIGQTAIQGAAAATGLSGVLNAIPGRASGQMPSNILGAIANEMKQAPGTTPVIANSSELILNPSQVPGFIQAIRSQSDRVLNLDLGGISVSSTNDLDAIIEAINYRLRLELRSRLA